MPPPGLLLVLSAPSGAGKTTLARRFLARHPDASFSVSVTTRPPRGAERDGEDYHFVGPDRFSELVREEAFAEWADVHGSRYGTLRSSVEEALSAGWIAVFDIDVQGGEKVKALWPRQAVTVFVLPPSEAELERRLRARSTESEGAIARRLEAVRREVPRGLSRYDYAIFNADLDEAGRGLDAIVAYHRGLLEGRNEADRALAASPHRLANAELGPWRRLLQIDP